MIYFRDRKQVKIGPEIQKYSSTFLSLNSESLIICTLHKPAESPPTAAAGLTAPKFYCSAGF
ncbi:hypothetical protein HOLDEFILI_03351 [Holdemania filiformis DSM 12042]|uniref:Uncharacterized protein n=1 Tax=Holdemania filiformis DSM 12042 TaxID=545696 RepID=B9YBZ4_9FIRM|nr:hypothetical protein HOLDEFILI_03351 [Holdemania filiformis DSM 12042]